MDDGGGEKGFVENLWEERRRRGVERGLSSGDRV